MTSIDGLIRDVIEVVTESLGVGPVVSEQPGELDGLHERTPR